MIPEKLFLVSFRHICHITPLTAFFNPNGLRGLGDEAEIGEMEGGFLGHTAAYTLEMAGHFFIGFWNRVVQQEHSPFE